MDHGEVDVALTERVKVIIQRGRTEEERVLRCKLVTAVMARNSSGIMALIDEASHPMVLSSVEFIVERLRDAALSAHLRARISALEIASECGHTLRPKNTT